MAWTPISGTVPQYQQASGPLASAYYLKAYAANTSTAISLATDSSGGTTLDKVMINTSGYPVNSSGGIIIPHVAQAYKLALFKNATDADNNTTSNADFVVDNIQQSAAAVSAQNVQIEYQNGSGASGAVFTLTQISYTLGVNNLSVYRNGQRLRSGSSFDYTETSATQVTLTSAPLSNDLYSFVQGETTTSTVADSSAVSYTPAGSGAVATNVQVKLREFISITDFGATGDGVTDDAAAIQAAIDAAFTLEASVYVPRGDFYIASSIQLRSDTNGDKRFGTWIIGDGPTSRIIGADNITMFKGLAAGPTSGSMFDFCGFQNLQIGAQSSSSKPAIGIDISEQTRIFADNLLFRSLDYGVKQTRAESPSNQCWSNVFKRCTFQDCDEWCVYIEDSYDITFSYCIFEASSGTGGGGGIRFSDDSTSSNLEYRNFRILNSTFQNLANNAIFGGAGLNLQIKNNYFEECSLDATTDATVNKYEIDLTRGNRGASGFVDNADISGNTFNTNSTNAADSGFYNIGVEKVINSTIWKNNYTNCSRRVEVTNSTSSDSIRADSNLSSTEVSTGSALVYGIDDNFQYANATQVQKSSIDKALRQIQKSDSRELTIGFASSKPSTSDHRQGSIYYNDGYTAATPFAWSCIAEGSPDTWKTLLVGARGTTTERDALSLGADDEGAIFDNETTSTTQRWTGSAWQNI